MNCRDIPEEMWKDARQSLYFYFSRRCGFDDAADLAQETLLRILGRPDYTFADLADFPKICHGFARHVALENQRKAPKWVTVDWEAEQNNTAQYGPGPETVEDVVLLHEVLQAGQKVLSKQEREVIGKAIEREAESGPAQAMAPADRVRLSRARHKLWDYIGWNKK